MSHLRKYYKIITCIILVVVVLLVIWLLNNGHGPNLEDFEAYRAYLETLQQDQNKPTKPEEKLPLRPIRPLHLPTEEKAKPSPLRPGIPEARNNRFVSKGERICCSTMERLYGQPFTSIRPNWLKNPETGFNMEIDCYNEELRMGVEYNGIQHYQWPNFTKQTYDQFINQTRRDALKVDLCEKNGVYLITVPYTIPHHVIPEYLMNNIPENRGYTPVD
jgi:hypothetical protein